MTVFNRALQAQDLKLRVLTWAHWALETLAWALIWIALSTMAGDIEELSLWTIILFHSTPITAASIASSLFEDKAWQRAEELDKLQEEFERASRRIAQRRPAAAARIEAPSEESEASPTEPGPPADSTGAGEGRRSPDKLKRHAKRHGRRRNRHQ